jgi:hypothetical protein
MTKRRRNALTLLVVTTALSLIAAGCSEDDSSNVQGSGGATPTNTGGATAGSAAVASAGRGVNASGGAPPASGGATQMPGSGGSPVGTAGAGLSAGGTPGRGGATTTNGSGGVSSAGDAAANGGANSGGATSPDGGSSSCDRDCLIHVLSNYLDALAARAPDKVPTAPSLKYTDNGVAAKLGDGLWKTASQLVAGERMDFADTLAGQVGSQLVIDENGTMPVIYQVRLKVVSGRITEIESMTVRQVGAANGFFSPQNMKPQPVFLQSIDASKRMTRDQLKSEVAHYIDYLDGNTDASGVHFDAMCARFENGVETANGLSSFQLQHWMFSVTARYLIFDVEMGLVWGMFPFTPGASALVVGELFKVMNSQIMMIQAVMADIPTTAWN